MTEFITEVLGRIVSSIAATYIIRLFDKMINKNDRHSPKHGH